MTTKANVYEMVTARIIAELERKYPLAETSDGS